MQEEHILIKRAAKGDEEAFSQLVERYQIMVYSLVLRQIPNPHDAEEVAQTVFLHAWRGLGRFRENAAFSTWLYRLTVNACLDFFRQNKKRQGDISLEEWEAPTHSDSPEQDILEKERAQALWRAIDTLSDEHRAVLLLREFEGFSYEEIADALSLELGTVRSRLSRARAALVKRLRADGNFFDSPSSEQRRKGGRK